MSVVVTLHIFSGVPDPSWELTEAQVNELGRKLASLATPTLLKPPGMTGGLGYRGFSITSVQEKLDPNIYVHAGIVDLDRFATNRNSGSVELEQWILATGDQALDSELVSYVERTLTSTSLRELLETAPPLAPLPSLLVVPPFDPGKWNNNPTILNGNNCYNYANDKITNTFAQPGRGSGAQFTSLDCSNVGAAAQRDGEVSVPSASSTPMQGHFIALVMWPGRDYHWYRCDSNARWSHKPGRTPARNVDNSNQVIVDPRTCNRGPYTQFCGFFHCVPINTRIR